MRRPIPTLGSSPVINGWISEWSRERAELERAEQKIAELRARLERAEQAAQSAHRAVEEMRSDRTRLEAEVQRQQRATATEVRRAVEEAAQVAEEKGCPGVARAIRSRSRAPAPTVEIPPTDANGSPADPLPCACPPGHVNDCPNRAP